MGRRVITSLFYGIDYIVYILTITVSKHKVSECLFNTINPKKYLFRMISTVISRLVMCSNTIISFTINVTMTIYVAFVGQLQTTLSPFPSSTRSSLDNAVMVQSASGIEADINQELSWEKMKLQNNFSGVARMLGTSLLLTCLTLHTIIQSMMQYSYGSVSAGREKWPFNVIFFLKVEPPCDQT